MNLIDLEAFVSVVDHGSIVAAAAALHLTQSGHHQKSSKP
jgi:DNA-binding transcriptional LysR family regulator